MRARALVAVAMALLTLAACSKVSPDATASSNVADIDDIQIGISDGNAPTITLPEGKTFTEPQGKVVFESDGAPLVDNQPLLLDVYGVSLADGSEIVNTFDGLPRSYVLAREVLGDNLYDLLIDGNVGMRVLVVAPATAQGGVTPSSSSSAASPDPTVALVVDVLSDRAVGTPVPPRADLPTVTVDKDTGEPTITIGDDLVEPATVQSETLIQGNGLQVKDGSYILVNYKAVRWKDGSEYLSSWPEDKAPFSTQIGVGQLIPALDEALLDQTTGSQVLVVAPPQFGYPDEGTLVFVVDILDVWTPED